MLASQQVTIFWEVIEPLGDRAYLEKVGPGGWGALGDILSLYTSCLVLNFLVCYYMNSQLHAPVAHELSCSAVPSCHDGLKPSETVSKSKSFLKEVVSVQSGEHRNINNQSGGMSLKGIFSGRTSPSFASLECTWSKEGPSSRVDISQQRAGFAVKADLIWQSAPSRTIHLGQHHEKQEVKGWASH